MRYYPGGPLNPNLGINPGQTLPDLALGGGYLNLTTQDPVLDTQESYQAQISFHDLYCSGKFKVALVNLSTGWCSRDRGQAQDFPRYGAGKWLPQGGIIFSILVEGDAFGLPAPKSDLDDWIAAHLSNYPLVATQDISIEKVFDVPSWPTDFFVDLRDMTVLGYSPQGYEYCSGATCNDPIYGEMDLWLSAVQ